MLPVDVRLMLLQSIYLRSAPLLETPIFENHLFCSFLFLFCFPAGSFVKKIAPPYSWRVRSEGKEDDLDKDCGNKGLRH